MSHLLSVHSILDIRFIHNESGDSILIIIQLYEEDFFVSTIIFLGTRKVRRSKGKFKLQMVRMFSLEATFSFLFSFSHRQQGDRKK